MSDPDRRLMTSPHGWMQGYDCQLAVADDQRILAARATQDHADTEHLTPLINAAQQVADLITNRPAASADYETFGVCADAGYGRSTTLTEAEPDRLTALDKATPSTKKPATNPTDGEAPGDAGRFEWMGYRRRTPAGTRLYELRGVMVEPINGHPKDPTGLRRFT